jgi:hypothetical protein
MDKALKAAIAELRAQGTCHGWEMDHLTDAGVLEGFRQAMTSMPQSTAEIIEEYGLTHAASALARLPTGTKPRH